MCVLFEREWARSRPVGVQTGVGGLCWCDYLNLLFVFFIAFLISVSNSVYYFLKGRLKLDKKTNKKPRVNLSLDPETFSVLNDLAAELNISNSALVNQVLSDSIPHMKALVEALKAAKSKTGGMGIKSLFQVAHQAYSDTFNTCLDVVYPENEPNAEVKSGRKRQRKLKKPLEE